MNELRSKIISAAIIIENLPELPGYNGSILTLDDTEAERISKDLNEACAAIEELQAENAELRSRLISIHLNGFSNTGLISAAHTSMTKAIAAPSLPQEDGK